MTDDYDDNEITFDDLDEEEQEKYLSDYKDEIDRNMVGLSSDRERREVADEFNRHFNHRRTLDGAKDARVNFLETRESMRNDENSIDEHAKAYMDSIDKDRGKIGEGRKMLKKVYARGDSAYFEELKRGGHI